MCLQSILPSRLDPLAARLLSQRLFSWTAPLLLPVALVYFVFRYLDQLLAGADWYLRLKARWFRMRAQSGDEDDKAEEIISIDLQGKSSLADVMVIASGRSARHVASIADHLAQTLKEATGRTVKVEGLPNADWVLLDIGDIIVHLFRPEVRSFYNLERIWSDDSAHGHA